MLNPRGYQAQQAAKKATTSFAEYLNSNSKELRNLQEIAHHLLLAAKYYIFFIDT